MKKKYLIKFIITTIVGYPVLFFVAWITNLSYKDMPSFYWLIILVADIFASALYCFVEYKHKIKSR